MKARQRVKVVIFSIEFIIIVGMLVTLYLVIRWRN